MANTLKVKRSATPSKVPTTSDLELGEIAVNTYDGVMYIKKDNGTQSVVQVGGGSGSGDVVGPSSATDNAVARFDTTTGKLIQNSVVTIDDNGNQVGVNSITFDITPTTPPTTTGAIYWDDGNKTPSVNLDADVTLQLGQEMLALVYNGTGSTITNGSVVAVSGAQGQRPSVVLADADSEALSAPTLGIATEDIANGAEGFVTTFGFVRGINTSGFTAGAPIYLSSTAGQFTATRPPAPAHTVALGWVIKVNASSGEVFVNINNGWELDELHNVLITSPISGNTLIYDASVGVWKNANITAGTGISVTNGAGSITIANTGVTSVTGTSPIASSGGATPAISISQASSTTNGYLSSTDWNTFNNKTSNTGTVTSITAGTGLSGGTITTSGTISLANTAVTAGSYTNANITVDAQGRITAASNGSAGGVTSITGTANQITASASTGAVTLSLPSTINVNTSGNAATATTATNQSGGTVNATTGTFSGTIYTTGTLIEAGRGTGSVALTTNDGYGNANVAFNHKSGTPDVNGSSGRIVCNVDSTTAGMTFQLGDNTTANTPVGLSVIIGLTTSLATFNVPISSTSTITGTSFSGAGTNLTGTAASLSIGGNAATATTATNATNATYLSSTAQQNLIVGYSSASTDVNSANDTGSFSIRGNSSTVASISFHRTGAYAINMGLGTDNVFRIGGWSASSNCFQLTGNGTGYFLSDLHVGVGGGSSSITMYDSDEGNRILHCNSNRIGFLSQVGNWGSYCNDDGSFTSDVAMYSPYIQAQQYSYGSSGNWNTDFQNTTAYTKKYNGDNANATNNPGGTWWFEENMRHSNSSSYWGTQIAWGWEDNANRLCQRNISGNSFSAWVEYLNTGGRTFSGSLTMSGNVSANSDERLKKNWRPVQEDFVSKLAEVQSGIYDRTDMEATQAGVSAQSLQKVLPEVVNVGQDEMLNVSYGNAAMVSCVELAKVIQELRAEIAQLKSQIKA